MAIDSIKAKLAKIDIQGTGLLAVAFLILVCWAYITAGRTPSPDLIWQFIMQMVGFTAYPLVPMAVFVIASVVMLTIETFEHDSLWAKMLKCIEVTAPVLGIIGTFVGIGLALKSLGSGVVIGDAITAMIAQIGTCIWSTVVGMTVGITAYILVENGVRDEKEDATDFIQKHPAFQTLLRREKRLIELLHNQKAEIKHLRKHAVNPHNKSTNS